MQTKRKSKQKYIVIFSIAGIVFIAIFLFFAVPFVIYENTLATQTPQHLLEQLQKRHEAYMPSSKINKFVKEAAVSSQDRRFYSNFGIDSLANVRALYFTLTTDNRQGASTITEQLAKNVYYHDRDTFKTDIETKILALIITLHFSKDKILEMYLNDIYYGKGAYGISQAAAVYFQTTPVKLSLTQSAYLIALINAPSYLSIHQNSAYKETKIVLEEMVNNGYISQKQESSTLDKFVR